jgi:HTH-type transcriptional regulator / antitoxin HigA
MIAVIKSEAQYREVLARVNDLVEIDPTPESDLGRELEVLAVLLQEYERRVFPLAAPSPITAVRLRMDQLGLAPKDLAPFLGSRSKVSEVLAGKRPLSLAMIRALNTGLGIPLESLVSEEAEIVPAESIEWDRFPIRELINRKWIEVPDLPRSKAVSFETAREAMESFFRPVGGPAMAAGVLHKTDCVRTSRSSDRFALAAWAGYVRRRAEEATSVGDFSAEAWGAPRLRELRSLSRYDVGPRLAIQFLAERGVVVIIEPHLKRTRLDGAAMLRRDGTPVIGLTVRHDRLDNFWFTLFHELMHILLHLKSEKAAVLNHSCYIDDLDVTPDASPLEKEADAAAREALLSSTDWEESAVRFMVAPTTVAQLARQVGVANAIVAGRVRYERRNYRLLSSMVGAGQVRSLFSEVKWPIEAA